MSYLDTEITREEFINTRGATGVAVFDLTVSDGRKSSTDSVTITVS